MAPARKPPTRVINCKARIDQIVIKKTVPVENPVRKVCILEWF